MKNNVVQMCWGAFAILWGLVVVTCWGGWLMPIGIVCIAAGCFCLWSSIKFRRHVKKGE